MGVALWTVTKVQSFRGDTCVQTFRRRAQHKARVCPVNRPKERFQYLGSEDRVHGPPKLINPEKEVQRWQELIFADLEKFENIEAYGHMAWEIFGGTSSFAEHQRIIRSIMEMPCINAQLVKNNSAWGIYTSTQTHAEALVLLSPWQTKNSSRTTSTNLKTLTTDSVESRQFRKGRRVTEGSVLSSVLGSTLCGAVWKAKRFQRQSSGPGRQVSWNNVFERPLKRRLRKISCRVVFRDLVEWVKKDRSGAFNIILVAGEPSRLLYEVIRKEVCPKVFQSIQARKNHERYSHSEEALAQGLIKAIPKRATKPRNL